jgi:hypothetical protein
MKDVNSTLTELQDAINIINKKDTTLVADLLLNLRYLVKHSAFKEEQECRIIHVLKKDDHKIKPIGAKLIVEAGSIKNHIKQIYFGPCVTDDICKSFEDEIKKAGLDISCEKSRLPFVNT